MHDTDIENHNPLSKDTYTSINEEMRLRSLRQKKRRIFFASSLGLVILIYLLYFLLPVFHVSSLNATGKIDLENEDFVSLSGYSSFHSLLFTNANKIDENIVTNSSGLVLSSETKVTPFSISVTVEEDHPVGFVSETGYLTSGKTLDEAKDIVMKSTLSSERKNALTSSLNQFSDEKSLPEIHFPKSISFASLENKSSAFLALKEIKRSSLNHIRYLQYVNESNNATWNNVMDVFIKGSKDNIYCLKNLLIDQIAYVFNDKAFPDNVISSIESKINTKHLEKENYTFLDEEKTLEVYSFKVLYSESERKTFIFTEDESSSTD